MQIPLEISFQDVAPSESIETLVRERTDRLERFHRNITSCHVHLRAPHRRHDKGNHYEVSIEARVPGGDFTVHQRKGDVGAHEHLAVAVRDAFSAMERKLTARRQMARGDVKTHDGPLQGKIAEIDRDGGFGQILATDHRLVYFHENSVVGASFHDLAPGDAVELVVQTGESETGPQASTVRRIGALEYDPG